MPATVRGVLLAALCAFVAPDVASAQTNPVIEFRLRPDGVPLLSPASPTLRFILEGRISYWGTAAYMATINNQQVNQPVGTAPSTRGLIGWQMVAMIITSNEPSLPNRLLTKGVLTASEFSPVAFPGDSTPTSDPDWQAENAETTHYGWTYTLRSSVNSIGEGHPANGQPYVLNNCLAIVGATWPGPPPGYGPVAGINVTASPEYQGAAIGLSSDPMGEGSFVPIYVLQYSTSDFSRRAFRVVCTIIRDGGGVAICGPYFRHPNSTANSGPITNDTCIDANPATAEVDSDPFYIQIGPTPCRVDLNGSRAADMPDIYLFLDEWFIGTTLGDWDHSGQNRVPDIFAFLADWFRSC